MPPARGWRWKRPPKYSGRNDWSALFGNVSLLHELELIGRLDKNTEARVSNGAGFLYLERMEFTP